MKTLLSISIVLLYCQIMRAQKIDAVKEFVFDNPVTKEKIKIEIGSKVTLWYKGSEASVTGSILSSTDSTLTLGIFQEPYQLFIPFRIVRQIEVIPQVPKRFTVWLELKSGEEMKGELIRVSTDSIILFNSRNAQRFHFGASEIKSIQIHQRNSVGKGVGIGAAAGCAIGAIIGYATYTPAPPPDILDFGPGLNAMLGALMGATVGSVTGLLIGLGERRFEIKGDPSRFDRFFREYRNQGLEEYQKWNTR